MLKYRVQARQNVCPRSGPIYNTGPAYEKLSLVRGGASWLLALRKGARSLNPAQVSAGFRMDTLE
jgi:hypothetical protein